jgi:cell division protein FtsQ
MRAADAERRILRRWTIVAFAVVVVATLAVATTYTGLFAAKDIELRGSRRIPRAELLSLARLNERSNVFHLDVSAVERRLERDPRIIEAHVTRSLPDRLTIEIVERMPVAVTGTPEALVGADGVVIGPADGAGGLPALIAADGGGLAPEALSAAAATAGAFDAGLRRAVDAVVVTAEGGVEIRLAAGFSASFGDASDLDAKAASLGALLAWIQERGVKVVSADLTVPGSPTAQLKAGSTAVPLP